MDATVDAVVSVADLSEFPMERIEAELVAHAAWEASGMARMVALLGEFDRREGWRSWGCVSPHQWLSWKCGLGRVAASERLRVARALPGLPTIADAFGRGLLSWSKTRALTRVATPGNEARLCDLARHATANQIETLVRAMRRLSPQEAFEQIERRSCRWDVDDRDGSIVITTRLPAEVGQAVINAITAKTTPVKGVPYRRSAADALVELIVGDTVVQAEVVVHTHPDYTALENGPAVAPEIVEALACNGSVTTVHETPDGPVEVDRQRAANRRQRRWLQFRHPTCQIDGCDHAGTFEVHHVVERAKGGPTRLSNLVRLCSFHHRLVHLHHLTMTLNPDRTIRLVFPAGNTVDRPITTLPFIPREPDPCDEGWAGDRLDLDLTLWAIFGTTEPE